MNNIITKIYQFLKIDESTVQAKASDIIEIQESVKSLNESLVKVQNENKDLLANITAKDAEIAQLKQQLSEKDALLEKANKDFIAKNTPTQGAKTGLMTSEDLDILEKNHKALAEAYETEQISKEEYHAKFGGAFKNFMNQKNR